MEPKDNDADANHAYSVSIVLCWFKVAVLCADVLGMESIFDFRVGFYCNANREIKCSLFAFRFVASY